MNKHALALVVAAASALTVTVNSASANIAIGLSESINGVEGAITTVVSKRRQRCGFRWLIWRRSEIMISRSLRPGLDPRPYPCLRFLTPA